MVGMKLALLAPLVRCPNRELFGSLQDDNTPEGSSGTLPISKGAKGAI